MKDPLVAAVTETVEIVLGRGVKVTPLEDGWLVQVASEKDAAPALEPKPDDPDAARVRRAW